MNSFVSLKNFVIFCEVLSSHFIFKYLKSFGKRIAFEVSTATIICVILFVFKYFFSDAGFQPEMYIPGTTACISSLKILTSFASSFDDRVLIFICKDICKEPLSLIFLIISSKLALIFFFSIL